MLFTNLYLFIIIIILVGNNVPTGVAATLSKRPSSSSGFSSARSEQSDASPSSNNLMPPLQTLAVFDQLPSRKTNLQILPNGTKERSIRTRAKNSPKLSPKVKRTQQSEAEESSTAVLANNIKMSESQNLSSKPFGSTGIPKPTAAVKGTAKVVKKSAKEEEVVIQRTPGDGKEVMATASKIHKTSVLEKPSNQDLTQSHQKTCNLLGSSLNTRLCQPSSQANLRYNTTTSVDSPPVNICPTLVSTNEPTTSQPPHNKESSNRDEDEKLNNLQLDKTKSVNQNEVTWQSHVQDQVLAIKSENTETNSQIMNGCHVAKVLPMSNTGLEQVTSDQLSSTTNASPLLQNTEEEEDESMNVQPMVPLFNTSHLGLKRHDQHLPSINSSGGSSASAKRANVSYCDPLDGYLSEGGASLYARKLHYIALNQRNKDEDR